MAGDNGQHKSRVSPTRKRNAKNQEQLNMDTGKILLGIALVMFSGALMVNPSGAMVYDSPQVGSGELFVTSTFTVDDSGIHSPGTGNGTDLFIKPSGTCDNFEMHHAPYSKNLRAAMTECTQSKGVSI